MAARSHHYIMTDAIPFRGFDERGDVRIYQHGILPHWRQDGCTYFVTFRQADSLPVPVLREMEAERHQWLHRHGIDPQSPSWKLEFAKLPAAERREFERQVGVALDRYLDAGHGSSVLPRRAIKKVLTEALHHFHATRVLTGDYVIMPNHVHVLMRPLPGFELEDILHSIKSFTANEINKLVGESGEFWQRQSYDHIVRDYEQLEAFQQYIALNPVKAGLSGDQFAINRSEWRPDE